MADRGKGKKRRTVAPATKRYNTQVADLQRILLKLFGLNKTEVNTLDAADVEKIKQAHFKIDVRCVLAESRGPNDTQHLKGGLVPHYQIRILDALSKDDKQAAARFRLSAEDLNEALAPFYKTNFLDPVESFAEIFRYHKIDIVKRDAILEDYFKPPIKKKSQEQNPLAQLISSKKDPIQVAREATSGGGGLERNQIVFINYRVEKKIKQEMTVTMTQLKSPSTVAETPIDKPPVAGLDQVDIEFAAAAAAVTPLASKPSMKKQEDIYVQWDGREKREGEYLSLEDVRSGASAAEAEPTYLEVDPQVPVPEDTYVSVMADERPAYLTLLEIHDGQPATQSSAAEAGEVEIYASDARQLGRHGSYTAISPRPEDDSNYMGVEGLRPNNEYDSLQRYQKRTVDLTIEQCNVIAGQIYSYLQQEATTEGISVLEYLKRQTPTNIAQWGLSIAKTAFPSIFGERGEGLLRGKDLSIDQINVAILATDNAAEQLKSTDYTVMYQELAVLCSGIHQAQTPAQKAAAGGAYLRCCKYLGIAAVAAIIIGALAASIVALMQANAGGGSSAASGGTNSSISDSEFADLKKNYTLLNQAYFELKGNYTDLSDALALERQQRIQGDNTLDAGITRVNDTMSDFINQQALVDATQNQNMTDLSDDLAAEISRAKAAEQQLTTNIATESARAIGVEQTITGNLAAETVRAVTAEGLNAAAITAEAARAEAIEAGLQQQVSAVNATVTDQGNQIVVNVAAIAAEVARAQGVEGQLGQNITTEVSRAEAAEAALGADISQAYTDLTIAAATNLDDTTKADLAQGNYLIAQFLGTVLHGNVTKPAPDSSAETTAAKALGTANSTKQPPRDDSPYYLLSSGENGVTIHYTNSNSDTLILEIVLTGSVNNPNTKSALIALGFTEVSEGVYCLQSADVATLQAALEGTALYFNTSAAGVTVALYNQAVSNVTPLDSLSFSFDPARRRALEEKLSFKELGQSDRGHAALIVDNSGTFWLKVGGSIISVPNDVKFTGHGQLVLSINGQEVWVPVTVDQQRDLVNQINGRSDVSSANSSVSKNAVSAEVPVTEGYARLTGEQVDQIGAAGSAPEASASGGWTTGQVAAVAAGVTAVVWAVAAAVPWFKHWLGNKEQDPSKEPGNNV